MMLRLLILFLSITLVLAEWRRCGTYEQTKKICKTSMHRCNWNLRDMCDVGKVGKTQLAFLQACKGMGVTESLSCDKARNKVVGTSVDNLIKQIEEQP